MCYIASVRFHETTAQRRIEIINEFILMMLCAHYVAFTNPVFVWEKVTRDSLGTSIIVFVCTLLGVNTLVILGVNVMAVKAACRKRAAKKKFLQEQKELAKNKSEASNIVEMKAKTLSRQDIFEQLNI